MQRTKLSRLDPPNLQISVWCTLNSRDFKQAASSIYRFCCLLVVCASQEETRITQVADPWGGSYMMESLTEDMVQAAKEIVDEVR